jgi:DDE superfamily endonuclease/Helix-turn-helix of DDE superfamily endonuclease
VPSVHLPTTAITIKRHTESSARAIRTAKREARIRKKAADLPIVTLNEENNQQDSFDIPIVDPVVPDLVPDTPTNADFSCQAEIPKTTVDVACQTTPAEDKIDVACGVDLCKFSLIRLIKNDDSLKVWTGLPGFRTLNVLAKIVRKVEGRRGPVKLLLDVRERIVLTLVVMRHSIQYNILAVLFGVDKSTISRYFHTTIISLAEGLHSAIYWPTDEENLKSMPVYFVGHFEDTKVVLDCTESKIQTFNCLNCRIESYSNYKSNQTAKYLLGVTPAGSINFVSRGYPGRASDKYIFNHENVIQLLTPGVDAVMIDKGFAIETELASAGESNILKFALTYPFLEFQE